MTIIIIFIIIIIVKVDKVNCVWAEQESFSINNSDW